MAVRCLKCGYTMDTGDEIMATAAHVVSGIIGILTNANVGANVGAPIMNQQFGTSGGVKCPKCGTIGRWENWNC